MKNESPEVLIGQGVGVQQPWAMELQWTLEQANFSVWNEPLPNAELPQSETPQEWSRLFENLISSDLTAILHSASVISFLDALLRKGEPIKNIYFLAAWLQDPVRLGGREGKTVQRVFTCEERYLLQPFLELAESFLTKLKDVATLVRGEIFICQSLNDPYVTFEQANFLQRNLGGMLIKVPDAGHFQFRPANAQRPSQNETLPLPVRQRILDVLCA